MKRILLWDWPTRLFHWLLVLAIVGAVITGMQGGGLIELHGRLGIFVVALLAFRVVWGFIGGNYSRFFHFFPTPSRVLAYLRGQWNGLGHNPLGAFSVFGLLALAAFQAISGLFTNDDISFNGPLFSLVSKDVSDWITGWHTLVVYGLMALVVLHICAIMFYAHVKKDNLVKPMITGYKEVADGEDVKGGGIVALLVALAVAVAAVYFASGAWIAEPPPPVSTQVPQTPSW